MAPEHPAGTFGVDLPLQRALALSAKDRQYPVESLESQQDGAENAPPRYTIEDCIRNLSVRQRGALPNMQIQDGDTLVFIDPPSKQPEQSEEDYDDFLRRYQDPIVMSSLKLADASPVFKNMLAPSQQYRILRRRGLVNKLVGDIKYVLDLTPPTEGDDAVYLTATLSCCEGVRFWHQACEIWNVSTQLVGGSEEWSTSSSPEGSAPEGLTLEYSPIRHRSAIKRVLAAIGRFDMGLDSATKLWTAAVIAGYFGITSQTCPFLTDSLLTWLRVEPNNHFVEVNPEVTLQIATFIQNEDLARDVFAILIGEAALDVVLSQIDGPARRKQSVFGRKHESLPEAWIDRIEYASKAFSERHANNINLLVMNGMAWVEELPSIMHLRSFHEQNMQSSVDALVRHLKELVKHELAAELVGDNAGGLWDVGDQKPQWRLLPQEHVAKTYQRLSPAQRIWTRPFWEKVRSKLLFSCRPDRCPEINYEAIRRKCPDDPLIQFLPTTNYTEEYLHAQAYIETGQFRLARGLVHPPKHFTKQVRFTSQARAAAEKEPSEGLDSYCSFKWDEHLSSSDPLTTLSDSETKPLATFWDGSQQPDGSRESSMPQAPSEGVHPLLVTDPSQAIPDGSPANPTAYDHPDRFFNLLSFFSEVNAYVNRVANEKLAPSDVLSRSEPFNTRITPTLTSLTENEWKYLPMWAGGLDDETGAIFSDEPMEAPAGAGFSTSGPSIHTGDSTYSTSSFGGSDFDMMSDADSTSTSFNLSTAVADGHSDQIFKGKIYTPASTIASDTDDGFDREVQDDLEEEKAKLVIRSFEQQQQREQQQIQGTSSSRPHAQNWSGPASDDCYDDLFDGSDSDDDGYGSDSTERGEVVDLPSDDDDDGVLVERAQAESSESSNDRKR